jgi:tripartite-type tricarboxylate transporter receptor subunit TctC
VRTNGSSNQERWETNFLPAARRFTVAESLPGYAADPWIGLFAPAGTPADIVARLNAEVARAFARPEVRESFLKAGLAPAPMRAEAARRFVIDNIEKWGRPIRSPNLKPQ